VHDQADGPTPDPVLAAVDIGTNSVHMVVARVSGEGRMEILAQEKEMVRLGRSAGDMKELAPDAIDRGVAALQRCRRVAAVELSVSAPLVGRAVERAIASGLREHLADEAPVVEGFLGIPR